MVHFLRFGTRMGLGFASVVLIFSVVILAAYVNMLAVDDSVAIIREFNIPKLTRASAMRASMFHMRLAMLKVMADPDRDTRLKHGADVRKHRQDLLNHIAEFDKLVQLFPFPEEAEAVKIIKSNLDVIIPFQEQLISSATTDSNTFNKMSEHAYVVIAQNDKLMAFERDRIVYRAGEVTKEVKSSERIFILAICLGIILAALMSFLMTRTVTQPVEDMRLRWSQWQQRASK